MDSPSRGTDLNRDTRPDGLTRSICEEALDRFSHSDDSLAGLIEANNIEVRDFMILSFVCDQNQLAVEQLMRALGLSRESVLDCVERLVQADLVVYRQVATVAEPGNGVSPTSAGRMIARRVLDGG